MVSNFVISITWKQGRIAAKIAKLPELLGQKD
jgi:hypothetical protein